LSDALRELAQRIERLARPSDDGRFSWSRLIGRLLSPTRGPAIRTEALARLLDRIDYGYSAHLHPKTGGPGQRQAAMEMLRNQAEGIEPVAETYQLTLRELRRNVARAERTCFLHGRLPDGHLDRLWRLYQVVQRAGAWVADPRRRRVLRELISADARCALSPLTTASSHGDARPVHGVDALIAAASAETRSLGRQRRLLEAARQQLLDAGAAVRLDAAAERARRILLSRRIARINRFEAAGVAPDVDLGYQVREAAAREEVPRLQAALSALEESAFAAGDFELQRLATAATSALAGGVEARVAAATRAASLRTSEEQLFGPRLRGAIDRAYVCALNRLEALKGARATSPETLYMFTDDFFDDWERFLTGRSTDELLAAATASGGCFQVGGPVSPGHGGGEALRAELVSFPQQEMVLEPIGGVGDLATAVIGDPRAVLLDLAAGRLLARRYIAMRPRGSGERRMQNEVRVYVLDASSSMLGPRARMRDALLLAELSTLTARLQDPLRGGNQVLYYRFFNDAVGEVRRVSTVEDAADAVDDVLGNPRYGGTNLQGALLASFEQIRLAAADDPDLARAQIVLVTDGEASIDEDEIRRAREDVAAIPVGVSIIALGAQNPELRKLAARQRARGERVFYQFIDDEDLQNIVDGESAGLPLHLPLGAGRDQLTAEVRSVLADIDRHLRRIDADQIGRAAEIEAATAEVGLPAGSGLDQRTRARMAAIENDRVSLDAAFVRAFPPPPAPEAGDLPVDPVLPLPISGHVADVVTTLTTVAEVVESYGAGMVERRADALELLERLLAEANVPPWAYADLVRRPVPAVAVALEAVHAAVRFGRRDGGGSG
jgi:hypothetical protein